MRNRTAAEAARTARPWVFSFITIRAESFGCLVFNPFLGDEVALDQHGTEILRLMDGCTTVREIADKAGALLGASPADVKGWIQDTLSSLSGVCALASTDRTSPQPARIVDSGRPAPALFRAPKNVTWEVTRACNLRCLHCLSDSGTAGENELTTGEALALVEDLHRTGVFRVSFTGGEPLLRPDLPVLIDAISSSGMSVDIATNGVGVPEDLAREIARRRIYNVQVSIDGLGDEHDFVRGMPGAFEQARDTIRRLLGLGLSVSVGTTATALNIERIDRIIDFALKEGCFSFKAIPFLNAGRGRKNADRLRLGPARYKRLCEVLRRRHAELRRRMGIFLDSSMYYLVSPEIREPSCSCSPETRVGCSAGQNTLNIGPDGTAYPCPFLADFPLGNLRHAGLGDLWADSPVLNRLRSLEAARLPARCASCGYLGSYCNGGCRAAAYLETGDLYGMDPSCFKGVEPEALPGALP